MEGAGREEVNDWNPTTHLGRVGLQKAHAGAMMSQEEETEPESCTGAGRQFRLMGLDNRWLWGAGRGRNVTHRKLTQRPQRVMLIPLLSTVFV